jgi:ADP-heptose:LPS heptosyltransferase
VISASTPRSPGHVAASRPGAAACLNPLAGPPSADRILVIRLGAVGDVVRTLPALTSLRSRYAGSHIAWLVEPAAAGAIEAQPWIDEVLVFPRDGLLADLRGLRPLAALGELTRFARRLRARRFDLVLDFHALLRSGLLARASGARRRASYARPFAREGSWLFATDRARIEPRRVSRFERNAALVRFLGVDEPPWPAPWPVAAADRARMLAPLGGAPAPVAIHPGSSDATAHKRYAAAGFARVARALAERFGVPSIATWGPARDDRQAARALVEASGGAARLAPATRSLADLAALLSGCRLFIGGDTGPLHVASLVGTPVVQVLGPTDPVENAPWAATPSRSVRAGAGGIDGIPPDAILEAASALLAAGATDATTSRAGAAA